MATLRAQVVMDGTLGRAGALSGPAFHIPADLGRQVGPNLFHSFSKFNVAQNESATFSGPSSVQNILARVTGGSASSIDGTLRSTISGANLYLINPSGLIFGPNAVLDISGSFVASTADYVKLADGGRFEALSPANSVLSAASVEKFGFLTPKPSKIAVDGSQLAVASGQSITVVSGDLEFKNGALFRAPGGAIKIVSVGSPGELSDTPELAQLSSGGTVTLTDKSLIDTSGEHGGPVTVRATQLVLDGSSITATTTGAVDGQPMDIALEENLLIQNGGELSTKTEGHGRSGPLSVTAGAVTLKSGGEISASSNGSGDAANLTVRTKTLSVTGTENPSEPMTGILDISGASASGNGGSIDVRAESALQLSNGGVISTSTYGQGNAGHITVTADSISLDLGSSGKVTGIVGFSYGPESFGSGGDLNVQAGQLQILGGAEIAAATWGHGPGGNVHVKADSIFMDGRGAPFNTTINSYSINTGQGGPAGDVTVEAGDVTCRAGSFISSSTGGLAPAGKVSVTANTFSADGSGSGIFTGIRSTSDNREAGGDAGQVTVNVKDSINLANGAGISSNTSGSGNAGEVTVLTETLTMLTGGQISSDTAATGDAGKITIRAGSMRIEGADDNRFQGVTSNTYDGSTGNAGDVEISVNGSLVLQNGGRIATTSFGTGDGGQVKISADSMIVDGVGGNYYTTGIASDTYTEGHAGKVTLSIASSLDVVNGGQISSDTHGLGNAGNVTIHAGTLTIDGANSDTTTGISSDSLGYGPGGNAGSVNVTVKGSLELFGTGQISSDTYSQGHGGDVIVNAQDLRISGATTDYQTFISSDSLGTGARAGKAGDVNVTVPGTLEILNGATISSDTYGPGSAGAVVVNAGNLRLEGNYNNSGGLAETSISSESRDTATGRAGDVSVSAGSLMIDGGSSEYSTGISSDSNNPGQGGAGGNVTVSVSGVLKLLNGGSLTSDTYGLGRAGDVSVYADAIIIDRAGSHSFTGVSSESRLTTEGGDAGTVKVQVKGTLQMNGQISSSTFGLGNAGAVSVSAHDLFADAQNANFDRGIISKSYSRSSGGNAGRIGVNVASQLLLSNGAIISSTTLGAGSAGEVSVSAGKLTLEGANNPGVFAATLGSGDGGSVTVHADTVLMQSGSLTTQSSGAGDGGTLELHAGSLEMEAGAAISSASTAAGKSGTVLVDVTGPILMRGKSQIATSADHSDAGKLVIRSGSSLLLQNSTISGRADQNGGEVDITSPGVVSLYQSQIISAAHSGKGGNISIDPEFVILNQSTISANAIFGNGGNITIDTGHLIQSADSQITASSEFGLSGTVNILGPSVDLSGTLTSLPGELLGAEARLPERCAVRLPGNISSFIVIGRGGLPLDPSDPLPIFPGLSQEEPQ